MTTGISKVQATIIDVMSVFDIKQINHKLLDVRIEDGSLIVV